MNFLERDFLEMFNNDLCRPLKLNYERDDTRDMVDVGVFAIGPDYFANSR